MAKSRKVKRYSNIYGRRKRRNRLMIQIAISVAAFLLLVAAVYFIAQGIVYISSSPAESSASSQQSVPEESVSPSSQPEPQPQQTSMKVRQMSASVASSASRAQSFVEQAKAVGFDAVAVPLKTKDGEVLYDSSVKEVSKWQALNPSVDAQALVALIQENDMVPVAQIYAFQDNTAAHASRDNTYYYGKDTTTTRKFEDGRYLNPYKEAARTYICDIVRELGTMGFSQVLLDGVQFPSVELTSNIGTDANGVSKSDILKQFIGELNATGVSTILSYDWSAIGGGATADLLYGGDPSAYGAHALAPVIDPADPPENIEASQNDLVAAAIKAAADQAPNAAILPELKAGKSAAAIEQTLQENEILSYIEISSAS